MLYNIDQDDGDKSRIDKSSSKTPQDEDHTLAKKRVYGLPDDDDDEDTDDSQIQTGVPPSPTSLAKLKASPLEDPTEVMAQLQTEEHTQLLDAIDMLRTCAVTDEMAIPQIIVCGDQSSGKSAVLAAISRLPFKSGVNMTTCFVTEVVMRRGPKYHFRASIEPDPSRIKENQKALRAFKPEVQTMSEIPRILEDASAAIAKASSSAARVRKGLGSISRDTLRIEVYGPDQPQVTLVDLPGLIKHDGSSDADQTQPLLIDQLVEAYIQKPGSIVLAVATGTNDCGTQSIFKMLADCGATDRALGIVTKPDLVQSNEARSAWVSIIEHNDSPKLGYGWHVICNQMHEEMNLSRDKAEEQLLSSKAWKGLSRAVCGIHNLRKKLGDLLLHAIQGQLVVLRSKVHAHLEACSGRLEDCGTERTTPAECRRYLRDISRKLRDILDSALIGTYTGEQDVQYFFDLNKEFRLRDQVRQRIEVFAKTMRGTTPFDFSRVGVEVNSQKPPKSFSQLCDELYEICQETQGIAVDGELPGQLLASMFKTRMAHWASQSSQCRHDCQQLVWQVVHAALQEICPKATADKLRRQIIEPQQERRNKALKAKVDELIWPYARSHMSSQQQAWKTAAFLHVEDPKKFEGDTKTLTAHQALMARALYKVERFHDAASNVYIDNFAALGIERVLLFRLSDVFSSDMVHDMDDALVNELGAEPQTIRDERERLTREIDICEQALRVFSSYSCTVPASVASRLSATP